MAALNLPKVEPTRWFWGGVAATALGAAGLGAGLALQPERVAFSYLVAFSFTVSIAVGALLLLMLGYAVNGKWMATIRRVCEAAAIAVLPLAVLFVPLLFWRETLYPWADPNAQLGHEAQHAVEHNRPYLNTPGFVARAAAYFALWGLLAILLRVWSTHRTQGAANGDAFAAVSRERALSSALMLPAVLAVTFASFDWMMSLEPAWYSSMYGLYYLTGAGLAGIAAVTFLAHLGVSQGLLEHVVTPNHFHALGRLLFAFVILWAYTAYFQLFLIVLADEPREVVFYITRGQGYWRAFGRGLALGKFAIPVVVLLKRSWKFNSGFMALLSLWLLLMQYADIYYLVIPVVSPQSPVPHWTDLAAVLAVLGACVAFCARLQRGLPLAAEHDPLLPLGVGYRSDT